MYNAGMKTCKRCKKPVESFPLNKHGKASTMCLRCYEDTCRRNAKKFELSKAIQARPPEGMGFCMACKKPKPLADFEQRPNRRRSIANAEIASTCVACREYRTGQAKANRKAWPAEKKQRIWAERREYMRSWRDKIINAYGGRCVCCGETEPKFLEIDHIDGGGCKHRKEIGPGAESLYRWVEKHNFPPTLQVLCANCHNAKSFHGGCPHQEFSVLHLIQKTA